MTRAPKSRRGGARPGAGRPPTGRTVRPVQFHLPPSIIAAIDAMRGDLSRSQWLVRVIEGSGLPIGGDKP